MPLFMDVHNKVEGLTAEAVADAHRKDMAIQDQHGVKYHRYWFNPETGRVFCLVEAPNRIRGRPSAFIARRMAFCRRTDRGPGRQLTRLGAHERGSACRAIAVRVSKGDPVSLSGSLPAFAPQ